MTGYAWRGYTSKHHDAPRRCRPQTPVRGAWRCVRERLGLVRELRWQMAEGWGFSGPATVNYPPVN